jgi:segregation and condensation protein B
MSTEQILEAILFHKSEPVEIKWLAKVTGKNREEISEALGKLREALTSRGVTLIETGEEVSLGTHPDASALIEGMRKEELEGDLGKAGLETLSIVLYKGPITKAGIEYIRGVNSQFTVRHLLVRGLIERVDNPKDARSFLYQPTIKLLSHLGLATVSNLPDFEAIKNKLAEIENATKPTEDQLS